ncbi:MAG TPA: BTAD domain-containing putative transcriptional regulator, partial [Trebonia sp.]
MLAVLLLNANRIVSVDELAEMLWGPDLPASARVTVQNYVKRLRHVLGDAERARIRTAEAGARLVTRHPGYLLQAAEDEVDVARFRRLCRDGGTAVREGAWDRADGLLGEALGLWRGAALADVPSDLLVRDEVPGLEELRLQAEEWRAESALHLGRHDELVPALQALAARHPLRERFHAQLMLALYRCGRQAEALAAYQHARHVLVDELGAEPGSDLQDLQQQVLAADPGLAFADASRPAGEAVPAFPYRGLNAFGEQDAGLFFGRGDATARVLELMSGCLDGAGLIIVSGVSGAGKSSLLHAGVLPGLRRAGLAAAPEAALWPCLTFTPGRSPVAELAVQVAPLTGVDAAALRQQLIADPAGFALTARQAALSAVGGANGKQRRVVLAVDQCEQLFTACESAQEREAFVTALHAAVTGDSSGQPPAALVMLVVRADFEARLADVPQLAAAVQDRYLLIAMTRRQLRLAITGPAAAAGCGVAEDLVQVLLEETGAPTADPLPPETAAGAGAGTLPLLSHALDQAWRARAGQQLTLADYERAGGIEGAVAASAQRVYQALTPAQQHAARQIFTWLAVPSSDGTDTALPAARADLTAGTTAAQAADVEVVLERFAAERLLTLDAGTVAVSHEVLLTAWPLLRDDWLADARADRLIRARLHATATEWAQNSRDPSYLYSGSRLEAAAATAARLAADPRQLPLSHADTDFLHASRRAGRRRVRARRKLTAVLLALLAALTTVAVLAVRARQAAATQRDIAVSRLLISQSQADAGANATVSRLQAIAAWALNPSPQARDAMLTAAANPQTATITADPGGVFSVAFSPDGKTLATSGPSGVRLWDVATGQQTGKILDGNPTFSVAFSPYVKTLYTTSSSYGVQLWDVDNGRPTIFSLEFTSLAFSPDGKTL